MGNDQALLEEQRKVGTASPLIRAGLQTDQRDGVSCFLQTDRLTDSDHKEYLAWSTSNDRRSAHAGSELFDDVVFKASSIKSFNALIPTLKLSGSEQVLEMGAGQAWASVLVKRAFPSCYVVASDIVPSALKFSTHYEELLDVFIDEKWAFNSRDIPFRDNQFDCIFTFAAFHHFGDGQDFRLALSEMVRVLKPGGRIVLLYEPSSPRYLYNLMYKQVNRRRFIDGVDEDTLVLSTIRGYENTLNSKITTHYYPACIDRSSVKSTLYYALLSRLRFLQNYTVCTVNVIVEKLA